MNYSLELSKIYAEKAEKVHALANKAALDPMKSEMAKTLNDMAMNDINVALRYAELAAKETMINLNLT